MVKDFVCARIIYLFEAAIKAQILFFQNFHIFGDKIDFNLKLFQFFFIGFIENFIFNWNSTKLFTLP